MKKQSLIKLMILGLMASPIISQELMADHTKEPSPSSSQDANIDNPLMSEKELFEELNPESIKTYQSLSTEGKKMALKMASSSCNGTNDCKGQNACKTEHNSCAGQGSCKGQGKCAVEPNVAVKLAAKKMAEKRLSTQNR